MSSQVSASLHAANAALVAQYEEHCRTVWMLQRRLREEVLPGVIDELGGTSDDLIELESVALEWIEDSGSVFRMLRRHKFTNSFALEAMRNTLLWRLRTFVRTAHPSASHSHVLRVLPTPIRDPMRRPIMIIKAVRLSELSAIADTGEDPRLCIRQLMDALRLLLRDLEPKRNTKNQDVAQPEEFVVPLLQYTLILDVQNVSMRTVDLDLLQWYMNELQPRFPGIVGSVLVVNYSWTQSGLWNVAKRLLPASALSKIIFMNDADLVDCLSIERLPQEYGGALPSLSDLPDALEEYLPAALSPPSPADKHIPAPNPQPDPTLVPVARVPSLLPTSLLNPFFGYPVSSSLSSSSHTGPGLKHGRRRKRDLARTLLWLWWEKWQRRVGWVSVVGLVWLAWRLKGRWGRASRSLPT